MYCFAVCAALYCKGNSIRHLAEALTVLRRLWTDFTGLKWIFPQEQAMRQRPLGPRKLEDRSPIGGSRERNARLHLSFGKPAVG